MLCKFCGGATRVMETRADEHSVLVKRRRACQSCQQRFWTFEIDDDLEGAVRDAMKLHLAAVLKRRKTAQRNRKIVERLLAGERVTALAKEIGVSQATASRVGNAAGIYARGPYRSNR